MVRTHEPALGPGASIGNYEIIMPCGAGTYGAVYRAIHKTSRRVVALKKVTKFPLEDGCPVECKYLEKLVSSRNIVNMLEYFYTHDGQLVLIFEYMEMDLWKLISGPNSNVPLLQMKCIMKQLFEGLHQCHAAGIMHRDVKPSNLLINDAGVLKLADFGLTTSFVKPPYLSNNVVSLYYRPPELLMGSHDYGPEIDIWSAGCILVELLTNDYLFAGSNESDQLDMIFKVFGTPDESIWPGVSGLPGWGLVETGRQHPMRELVDNYKYIDSSALDLASRLLQLDPKKRISSSEALNHPWFNATPLPCLPSALPVLWRDKKAAKSRQYESTNSHSNITKQNHANHSTYNNQNTDFNNSNTGIDNPMNYNASYNNYNNMCYYNNMNYYNNFGNYFYNNVYVSNGVDMGNYYLAYNANVPNNNFNQYYFTNCPNGNMMYYNNGNNCGNYYNNYATFNNYNQQDAGYNNYNYGGDDVSRQRKAYRNGPGAPRPRYNYAQ